MPEHDKILVANIGSTSFKFRLFEMPSERVLASGSIERIGSKNAPFRITIGDGETESGETDFQDYASAISWVSGKLKSAEVVEFDELAAIGFKPVMAKDVSGTQIMDEGVLGAMEAMNALFPAHNPPYISAVRAFTRLYPSIPCIGTFETAYYDDLPEANRRFPIPLEWERDFGVRRTGFHGASHKYVNVRAAEITGRDDLRVISCHLGGSSSICASRGGKAINSSWGMTTQSGMPHNNRVGDFDVFAFIHLLRDCGLNLDTVENQLSSNAGLKGMSGLSSGDFRDLDKAAADGNDYARTAIDYFVASTRKFIGQFLVDLDGADMLVFTAGIGENNTTLRAKICEGMTFCGLELDTAANASVIATEGRISLPASRIDVRVIPANEELIIARNAWAKLQSA